MSTRWLTFCGRSLVVIIGTLVCIATPHIASAHEHRTVGAYDIEVGFVTEPAVVDVPNGLHLGITKGAGDAGTPVDGMALSLKAEVIYGGQRRTLELQPAFNDPGVYTADFIPSAEGTYNFHIFGAIDGTPVDETFTGGPTTFSDVEPRAAVSFPDDVPSLASLATANTDASNTADSARLLAIIAIGIGVVGLAVGIAGFLAARSARTVSAFPAQPTSPEAPDHT